LCGENWPGNSEDYAMLKLVFDAGPLITACKFHVEGQLIIDHILTCYQIVIPSAVYDEVVIAGARFPDAQDARHRVDTERIGVATPVLAPSLIQVLNLYGFGEGEQEAIGLMSMDHFRDAMLVVDDHLAYVVSDRLGIPKLFLLDLIVRLTKEEKLTTALGCGMVEAIRTRYPESFFRHTLLILKQLER
jgi:predicted nucleic acid-binding protein